MDAVVQDLMAAIGNPDTGSSSEAMTAFEASLTSRDAAAITSTAEVVLGHLASGRTRIAAIVPSACLTFCPEWDLMLAGIADAVTAMRDAGIAGDRGAVDAGRTQIQAALLDHFWQGIRGNDPNLNVVNLRDGRVANASRMRWSTRPDAAFDGDAETAWTTGDAAAPQWIEVGLAPGASLASVRLLTFQDVAGPTDHRVSVCGADGRERELVRFAGTTSDREWLEHQTAEPVADVRVVRVTTTATPSTIGWREIEIASVGGGQPGPSAATDALPMCGATDVTAGATVTGQPSEAGREPALAIDDDPATGWDPGTSGSIRIALSGAAAVSEIRLFVGEPTGSSADVSFIAVLPTNERLLIGELSGAAEAGVWRSLANSSPSITFSVLEVYVRSASPAPEILEIEVLGRPLH